MLRDRVVRSLFLALIAAFIVLVIITVISRALLSPVTLPVWAIAFALSIALIVLTVKRGVEEPLKAFLVLTGASVLGFPVFVVLHNLVSVVFDAEEPFFFVLATLICPLGFLAGLIGSIVMAIKTRQTASVA